MPSDDAQNYQSKTTPRRRTKRQVTSATNTTRATNTPPLPLFNVPTNPKHEQQSQTHQKNRAHNVFPNQRNLL